MGASANGQGSVETQIEQLESSLEEDLFETRAGRLSTYQSSLLVVLAYYIFIKIVDGHLVVLGGLLLVFFINLSSLWLLRFHRMLRASAVFFMTGMFISIISGTLTTGCIDSPAIWSFSILPVMATSIFGTRGTVACWVLTILSVVGIYIAGHNQELAALAIEVPRLEAAVLCLTILASLSMSTYMTASVWNTQVQTLHTQHAELENSHQRAHASDQAKSKFLARMSHELRTPMNGLLGATQSLLVQGGCGERRGSIEIIQRCAQNLLTMLNDALDLSKVEAEGVALKETNVDLCLLIKDVQTLFIAKARLDGIHLSLDLEDKELWAVTDATRIRQIVSNLVGNAVRYSEKGTITISMRTMESKSGDPLVSIAIKDEGIGMDQDQVSRLFRDFEQVHATARGSQGGTGLGLSISRNLIRGLGGDIQVESEPAKGSTFTVTFPFSRSTPFNSSSKETEAPLQRPRQAALEGARVLVVDDNPINLKVATVALKRLGILCDTAENGAEAVEQCLAQSYDAIFMDIRMPVMNGLDATRKIRALQEPCSKTPVIALTANAYAEDRSAAFEAGMNAYVSKPFKVDELEAALMQVTGQDTARITTPITSTQREVARAS